MASQLFTGDHPQLPRNAEGVLRNIRKAHRYGTADCIIVLNILISFVKLYDAKKINGAPRENRTLKFRMEA